MGIRERRTKGTNHMRRETKSITLLLTVLLVLSGCTMESSLEEMSQGLEDVAALKEPMEQVASLEPTLKAVAELDAPLKKVAELEPTLKAVAELDGPLKKVAELKAPLGAMARITQPTTYVPMFGYVGIVLFLAIWGGIKMGRR